MADIAKGSGRLLAGDQFEFTLDGLASASQMDKLINAIGKSLGGGTVAGGANNPLQKGKERLEKFNQSIADSTKANTEAAKAKAKETENAEQLNREMYKFKGALHSLGRGSLIGALESIGGAGASFALGLGTLVGSLTGYADKLTEGLQRGISGGIFDYAIAAKNAGVTIEQFGKAIAETGGAFASLGVGALVGSLTGYADKLTEGLQRGISGGIFDYAIAAKNAGVTIEQFGKAIAETGGGFASLGIGATDGAKQFGALVGSVRQATEGVGNLGMTADQIAMFTAQQTKTAVSQGFKGKLAQDIVIKNSRALGDELDTLANRTGKSVMELAAAAMKLAQDPIVANFVQTAKSGGAQVSKAVQQLAASLRGVLGEAGDAIASDLLKSALGNLPFQITQSGKNMLIASSSVYNEFERQARIVKSGGDITAADQERLRDIIKREVEARGSELRYLANLEGAAGDGARQLLALSVEANKYNSAAEAKRKEDDKVAQEFNAQIRAFQANMQKLAIPFLAIINTIDWTAFMAVLSGFAFAVGKVLSIFTGLGEVLGAKNIVGTAIGGLFGFASIIGLVIGAYSMYTRSLGHATVALKQFSTWLMKNSMGFRSMPIGPSQPGTPMGKGAALGMGLLGSGAAAAMFGGPQTTAGSVGSLAVGAGGAFVGRAAGAKIGLALGATAGPFAPIVAPLLSLVGATAGAYLGQWLGDKAGGAGKDLASVGAEGVGSQQSIAQAQLGATNKLVAAVEKNTGEVVAGNFGIQRSVSATSDLARITRENRLYG